MWADEQTSSRDRHWRDLERLLGELPPRLLRQLKLVEYDLALRCSSSGRFRDIFTGVDQFPLLSVGDWLLADWAMTAGPDRERAERHLFIAAALMAARGHTIGGIRDTQSFYDDGHVTLVEYLTGRAATELARLVPSDSPFPETWSRPWLEELEQDLEDREAVGWPGRGDDPEMLRHGLWSPTARILAAAAATLTGHENARPDVDEMLAGLAMSFQIRDDLSTLQLDLQRGRPSYAIAVVARAAGIALRPWPAPAVVLGALVATRSAETLVTEQLELVRVSRRAAERLHLESFAAYANDVEARVDRRLASLRGTGGGRRHSSPATPTRPLIVAAEPTSATALAMAKGFLLADPSFRESWESHREGMFGSPFVASRFPAGLVLEILGSHGHDVSAEVDEFLAFAEANGFRYYDHRASRTDTDTVGVYLRLARHAGDPDRWLAAAGTVLACLARDVEAGGSVPVWIGECEGIDAEPRPVVALGEGCGTVAAHLLLGLVDAGPDTYGETIRIGATALLDRIAGVGLRANVNYPHLYALGVFARLVGRLDGTRLGSDPAIPTREATAILEVALDEARRVRRPTAQEAALLVIACQEMGRPGDIDPRWAGVVLRHQRFDGSWLGEPFAAAPNRGRAVTWYSSTILTSALCYDALERLRAGA